MKRLILIFLVQISLVSSSQEIHPTLLRGAWTANWISCPDVPQREYGVYHFRRTFTLEKKPEKFIIHITADNRYRLFVNGTDVCSGPARGDLYNWYFETLDIAPYLKQGANTLAAVVWNMGIHAPVAQITNQTALLVQGNSVMEKVVNTGKDWKVIQNGSYSPCSMDNGLRLRSYMVVGPGDRVDASSYPWGWEQSGFDDSGWKQSVAISGAVNHGYGTDNLWTLKPRNIPLMKEQLEKSSVIRRVSGIPLPSPNAISSGIVVPPNKTVSILLDQGYLTVAFPILKVSQGKRTSVTMTYAEALFDDNLSKGNRNEIDGKKMIGNYDIFLPDGGSHRQFRPLWFRTYRYMQLDIITQDQPLIIEDISGMATGYPFEEKANFTSNDPSLKQIWDIGWRTARLCAGETYFDCPYYEQLQYEGDTRIQSLISLYVSGDDRLMRKALIDFDHSRVPEGLTQGRYPSNRLQVIPPFSLFWVSMVYDHWMHRRDERFVSSFLQPVSGVLDWFEKRIDSATGMLGPLGWWNFADWNLSFRNGVPDGATDGNSSVITLQYAYTLQQASELFNYFGRKKEGERYRELAAWLTSSTYKRCFDMKKGLMANTPLKNSFSQHASIMGVMSGAIEDKNMKDVMQRVLSDSTISQATFYYRFYLNRALKRAGLADLYYGQLSPWRGMITNGLTTFAENPDPTRSDCHAWSSSPNYDFLATICGIVPDSPGFSTVRIEPALGELEEASAVMPHPDGEIRVRLKKRANDGVEAFISLPKETKGRFIWRGKSLPIKGGDQHIIL